MISFLFVLLGTGFLYFFYSNLSTQVYVSAPQPPFVVPWPSSAGPQPSAALFYADLAYKAFPIKFEKTWNALLRS